MRHMCNTSSVSCGYDSCLRHPSHTKKKCLQKSPIGRNYGKFSFQPTGKRKAMAQKSTSAGDQPLAKRRRLSSEAKYEIAAQCADGARQVKVARMYGVTESCVSKIVRKLKKEERERDGDDTKVRRVGRPCKLAPADVDALVKIAEKKPFESARTYSDDLLQKTRKRVSRRTVQRYLKKRNVCFRRAAKKPLLTRRHRRLRLAWARAHAHWTDEDWMQVLFSDETTIEIHSDRTRRGCYRTPQQRLRPGFTVRTVKHPAKLMLWGCFGNGKVGGLYPVVGVIDSHAYIAIMRKAVSQAEHAVFGGCNFVLQQDNAPCHMSRTTHRWFTRHQIALLDWPPMSPDLNPIENLWGLLKKRVHVRGPFKSLAELGEAAQVCWEGFGQEVLLRLIRSMPERVKQVIASKGRATKY